MVELIPPVGEVDQRANPADGEAGYPKDSDLCAEELVEQDLEELEDQDSGEPADPVLGLEVDLVEPDSWKDQMDRVVEHVAASKDSGVREVEVEELQVRPELL